MADCGPEPKPKQILVKSLHVLPRNTTSLSGDPTLLTPKCLGMDEPPDGHTHSQDSWTQRLPGLVDPKPGEFLLVTGLGEVTQQTSARSEHSCRWQDTGKKPAWYFPIMSR